MGACSRPVIVCPSPSFIWHCVLCRTSRYRSVDTYTLTGRLQQGGVEVCTVLDGGQRVRFMQVSAQGDRWELPPQV
jgi:hypothetical protein